MCRKYNRTHSRMRGVGVFSERENRPMTYAEKLTQMRVELQQLAAVLMDDDDFELAQKVVTACLVIKNVHNDFAEAGFDEHEWSPVSES